MIEQLAIAVFGVTAVFLSQDGRASWRRWAPVFGLFLGLRGHDALGEFTSKLPPCP